MKQLSEKQPRTKPAFWLAVEQCDRRPITSTELDALRAVYFLRIDHRERTFRDALETNQILLRLLDPLRLTTKAMLERTSYGDSVCKEVLRENLANTAVLMLETEKAYWQWEQDDWVKLFQQQNRKIKWLVAGIAYILVGLRLDEIRTLHISKRILAFGVFGKKQVESVIDPFYSLIVKWGFAAESREHSSGKVLGKLLCMAMLETASPLLEDITNEVLEKLRQRPGITEATKNWVIPASKVLHHWGMVAKPLSPRPNILTTRTFKDGTYSGMSEEWANWIRTWDRLFEGANWSRKRIRQYIQQVGRWLNEYHPEITHPDHWSPELVAEFLKEVNSSTVGRWAGCKGFVREKEWGKPLKATTKGLKIGSVREFFRLLKRRKLVALPNLDIDQDFRVPWPIRRQISPSPRDIQQAVWLKLVWASLNLTDDNCLGLGYPPAMVKAVAIVWTHCGLRSNEIIRLCVGCVRDVGENVDTDNPDLDGRKPSDLICYLNVPLNKTNKEFTKPVGKAVAEKIRAWEAVRPEQPLELDEKSGDRVHFLFSFRGRRIGKIFINHSLIPILCSKAGVPIEDASGHRITSHRGRASAATWYYNTRDGMTLEELQVWLGHTHITSTQRYVRPSPVKQAKRFAQVQANSYLVEVLVDTETVASGRAGTGEPWQFFPLGNDDFCSNPFYAHCPHRMACAQCGFYVPAESQKASALRAKEGIQRMLLEMRLDDDERAAAEGGIEALNLLIGKLRKTKTPDGRTPEQIDAAREPE